MATRRCRRSSRRNHLMIAIRMIHLRDMFYIWMLIQLLSILKPFIRGYRSSLCFEWTRDIGGRLAMNIGCRHSCHLQKEIIEFTRFTRLMHSFCRRIQWRQNRLRRWNRLLRDIQVLLLCRSLCCWRWMQWSYEFNPILIHWRKWRVREWSPALQPWMKCRRSPCAFSASRFT